MLAHHLPSGSHSERDQCDHREGAQERQLEKLIAAGLVGSDARLRPKKKQRNVEFNASVSEISM